MSDEHVAKHEGPRLARYTPPKDAGNGSGNFVFTGMTDEVVRRAQALVDVLARMGVVPDVPFTTLEIKPYCDALDAMSDRLSDFFDQYDIERAYGYHPPDEPCEKPDADPTEFDRVKLELRGTAAARDNALATIKFLEEANGNQATTIAEQRQRIADLEVMLAGKLAIAEADPVFERLG